MSQDHWEYYQSHQRDKLLTFLKEYLDIHATPGADVSVIQFNHADDCQAFITWHNLNY
jgi:hypothetical protein